MTAASATAVSDRDDVERADVLVIGAGVVSVLVLPVVLAAVAGVTP